jgi:hypothetical protein
MLSIYNVIMFNVVRFEVLTTMVLKGSIFWDITSCCPLRINRRFGGTCRLKLKTRIKNQDKKQRESRCHWIQTGTANTWNQRLAKEFSRGQKLHRTSHNTFADKLGNTDLIEMPPIFVLVSSLAYSPTVKIEATYSSETSLDFQRPLFQNI